LAKTKEKEFFLSRFVFRSLLYLKTSLRVSYTGRWIFLQNAVLDKYIYLFCLAHEVWRSEVNDLGDAGNSVDRSEILMSHSAFIRPELNRTQHTCVEDLNAKKNTNTRN
jgi:hypothetical protein